jgi:hypothetical protein
MSKRTLPVLGQKRTGYFLNRKQVLNVRASSARWPRHRSSNKRTLGQSFSRYSGLAGIIFASLLLLSSATRAQTNRGPDVVIVAEENRLLYEFRQNGQLRYIRVVPKRGKPYYLVPTDATEGNGDLERVDSLVTSWVLWEFD